jgi:hypothetical protein
MHGQIDDHLIALGGNRGKIIRLRVSGRADAWGDLKKIPQFHSPAPFFRSLARPWRAD